MRHRCAEKKGRKTDKRKTWKVKHDTGRENYKIKQKVSKPLQDEVNCNWTELEIFIIDPQRYRMLKESECSSKLYKSSSFKIELC